jgi:hypothetical protein
MVVSADRLSNNGDSYIDFEFLQNTLSVTTNPGGTSGGFTGGSGTPTFSWTGPGGFNANTQSINISTAGIYSVIVTDVNSCSGQDSAVVGLCLNP